MASGKSKSQQHPDGVRRTKNGVDLPPRSKRRLPAEILAKSMKNTWHHGWRNAPGS